MPEYPVEQSADRIEKKFVQLGMVFDQLSASVWEKSQTKGLFLNLSIARNVAVSYLHDVERVKAYHKFKLIDEAKMAAYWTKWIIRLRPVQYTADPEFVTIEHLLANEKLAFFISMACLRVSPRILSRDYVRLLLYTWHYRQYEADSALPGFELLRRLAGAVNEGFVDVKTPL